ncbi:MAG TPA: ATP-grasp domain-containing protein [Candidatus Omnitrophota bacterium]|nr:ATP-grasp domain-containing protein [Candidatus Omnitrophota bacterium]
MKIASIGIVYNLKDKTRTDDLHEEYDEIETIEAIRDELESLGASVVLLEQTIDLASELIRVKPDMVFNIAEGIGKTRSRESQVPCLLESLGIPYTGSDPLSLGVTLDKYLTNTVLEKAGLPVPRAFTAATNEDADIASKGPCREGSWIVKPRWEGSSKGIFDDSLSSSPDDLAKKAARLIKAYEQPVIIEEFLPGDEITAAVRGNSRPEVFGMMKISPKNKEGNFIYSIEQKRDWREKIVYEAEAAVPRNAAAKIREAASGAFKALALRDIARIDFRVDRTGTPKIIDVNPLPGLSPAYSDLVIMCRLSGRSYSELIHSILSNALGRYNAVIVKVS